MNDVRDPLAVLRVDDFQFPSEVIRPIGDESSVQVILTNAWLQRWSLDGELASQTHGVRVAAFHDSELLYEKAIFTRYPWGRNRRIPLVRLLIGWHMTMAKRVARHAKQKVAN